MNFAIYRDRGVFRTTEDGTLAALAGAEVGFEVDEIDSDRQEGWSVLVVGSLARITDATGRGEVHKLHLT